MAELTVSWRITPGSEFSKVTSNATKNDGQQ